MKGFKNDKDEFIPTEPKKKVGSDSINQSTETDSTSFEKNGKKLQGSEKSKDVMPSIKIDWAEKEIVSSEHGQAIKYDATVKHNGVSETFEFTNSIQAYTQGEEPNDKDLIHALLMDWSSSFESREDFLEEFGYDLDSIKHNKIYDAVKANGNKMMDLFTKDELEQLQKEFEDY